MEETLKMALWEVGVLLCLGGSGLRKLSLVPEPTFFLFLFPLSFLRFSLAPYQVHTLSSFRGSMQIYWKKRLCKQRGRLKLTGLAKKSQTLSYRLSGVWVPFFILHRTSIQTEVSNCKLSHPELRVCRTVSKATLSLNSHLIYCICGSWRKNPLHGEILRYLL